MLTYVNEAAFSKALVTAMRHKGWFVQRIESGETGKGIPDIYCIDANKQAAWIELKRIKHNISKIEEIPWRTGQQSWLNTVTLRGQVCMTICCFNNGILVIRHNKIYLRNYVNTSEHTFFKSIKELLA